MRLTCTVGWRAWLASLAGLSASIALVGCVSSHDVDAPPDLDVDEAPEAAASSVQSLKCQAMIKASFDKMPDELECAGLYSDVAKKKLMAGAMYYVPAYILWSDGAAKQRWISLPKGEAIDTSDAANWKFPVGTRFFKEFGFEETGAIETRMFWKERDDFWRSTTYVWNENHTAATRDDTGKDVDVGSEGIHHIPSQRECEACHGSKEHSVLGFSSVSLGTPSEKGEELPVTLHTLADNDMMSDMPSSMDLTVGDDATGKAHDIVQWFHINCGVSCHNDDQNSEAYSTGLRLKLDPSQLDGRPIDDFSAIKSTVGVMAHTVQWANQVRIKPGEPENSLLYKEISSRGGGKNSQMPPIASNEVDQEHVAMVRDWILSLKPAESDSTGSSEPEPN